MRNSDSLNVISIAISIFNWDFVKRTRHPGFAAVRADEDIRHLLSFQLKLLCSLVRYETVLTTIVPHAVKTIDDLDGKNRSSKLNSIDKEGIGCGRRDITRGCF